MSATQIVNRLEFCRQTGRDKWIARCPSHEDHSPSLSIKDVGGGRTLIHCHAGCSAHEVLSALGMELSDLYPPTDQHFSARRVKHSSVTEDSLVLEIAEYDRARGVRLSKAAVERYRQALMRNPPKSDVIVEIAYEMGVLR